MAFIDRMKANQFTVTEIKAADGSISSIQIDMTQSGIVIRTPPPTPRPPIPPPVPSTDEHYEMDMTVFGVKDRSNIPQDGSFTSFKDRASDASRMSRKGFDPMFATIFLAATLLIFWG